MSLARFEGIAPVLPVRDMATSLRYYVDRLGFTLVFVDYSNPPTSYAVLRRDAVTLHLQWQFEADFQAGTAGLAFLRLTVDNPDALFDEYQPMSVFHERTALRDTPWGTREFAFFDLDGNGLTFYRNL